jgi:hypothetical protein
MDKDIATIIEMYTSMIKKERLEIEKVDYNSESTMGNILKHTYRKIFANVLFHTGIILIFRKLFPNQNPMVLMYHRANKERFEEQMEYLNKNYNVISLEELALGIRNKIKFKPNTISITFDDGYLNNYEFVVPYMKKHNIPAIIFIVENLIGTDKLAWWDSINLIFSKTESKNYIFRFDNNTIYLNLETREKKILLPNLYTKHYQNTIIMHEKKRLR